MSAASVVSGSLHRRVASKVSFWASTALALVLMVVCAALAWASIDQFREHAQEAMAEKNRSVADTVESYDATARVMARTFYTSFRAGLASDLRLSPAGDDLLNGETGLKDHFEAVDAFATHTGGVATIFLRQGDDFLRITTSLKKENGERAVGTKLGLQHPAYATLMGGQAYAGRANLFGKAYMTRYEPIKDGTGQVIGLVFVGFDVGVFDETIARLAKEVRFFESGRLVVIDPRKGPQEAVFAAHPTARGQKVIELWPQWAELSAQLAGAPGGLLQDARLPGAADAQWLAAHQTPGSRWWVVSQASESEAMADVWRLMRYLWLGMVLATVLLAVMIHAMLTRWVGQPLVRLQQAVEAVSQGDLTRSFHSDQRDEIGEIVRGVERMRDRLTTTLGAVRCSVESISTASEQIASGNQDLSGRTETTSSHLQQAASSMEQMVSTVRQTADSARTANQLAHCASDAARQGGEVVSQVVTNMEEITTSSRRIAEIIGVIDGIAFQTNILALNAAVEAARAGEQGRGFAVVAGEVRNLAQRSANAAREIKSLINASVEKVESGSRLVTAAGVSMNEIVSGVQRVSDIIAEISAASGEQSQGLGEINRSVTELDAMTQQNAALVEQSAAAAESLREQSRRLAQEVDGFRLTA
ncbi:methyl-accepting chemotaxis protein-2 (aspartate sensor receptor) [Sphaerotilus hippei]|uniref:Methyl-accepting chemotaxis protein-2 (Aspartate sensor receptor) n=1 Tax=Sphaerotilus hippei TaxID=744406 RepID=A0A318H0J0_9BURK|nr:methyl-accepting chemotaxis protein [Sphaerotilus hippei]PXW96168.1 methyl-accepting chemotaxis protein-2 (aspartate sensor receptor) [Sphaerotilus hippei]